MRPPPIQRRGWRLPWAEAIADAPDVALMATSPCDALRTSTLRDAGAGVERLLLAAADLRRPLPAEQPADAFWWRIVGEEARHRSTTPKAPRMRGLETPLSREAERHAKSVSRRRTGCCIGLIDQVVASAVTLAYSFVVSFAIAKVIDKTMGMRVDEAAEEEGLDLSQHSETAYAFERV